MTKEIHLYSSELKKLVKNLTALVDKAIEIADLKIEQLKKGQRP